MLPDFPKIKESIRKAVNAYLRTSAKQDPLFSDILEEIHFEGNRMVSHTMGGDVHESNYKEFGSQYTVKDDDIIEKGIGAFVEHFEKTTEEIKKQKSHLLFEKMDQSAEITGNKVDVQGELTFEHFLQMIRKIWIDFDEEGKPHMPNLVMHPQTAAKWAAKFKAWEADPENKKKFDELMKAKKAEWDDRESNRKLVD